MHIGLEMTTLRNSEVGGVWRYTESLVRALARRVGPHRYSLLFINAFNPWVRVPAPSVSWATLRNRSREECRDSTQGECRDSTRTISLRRDRAGDALRLTLLHEMCHIGQGDGSAHGPRFLRKLHRLVRLGESKLQEEIERYDGTVERRALASVTFQTAVMSTADMVAETLEGWAVDLDHLGKLSRWPKIRRALAERYEIAPSQVDRLAPGAAKHWRRLVTEARRGKAGWRKIQRLTGFQRSTTTHDPSEA